MLIAFFKRVTKGTPIIALPLIFVGANFAQDAEGSGKFSDFFSSTGKISADQKVSNARSSQRSTQDVSHKEASWLSWAAWVDFLYWQSVEESLVPDSKTNSLLPKYFAGLGSDHFLDMNFGYKPGSRIVVRAEPNFSKEVENVFVEEVNEREVLAATCPSCTDLDEGTEESVDLVEAGAKDAEDVLMKETNGSEVLAATYPFCTYLDGAIEESIDLVEIGASDELEEIDIDKGQQETTIVVKHTPVPNERPPCEMASWFSCETRGDFLYWQAIEENLEPCSVEESVIPISNNFTGLNADTFINMSFDYQPAFQVSTSFKFDHEYLDLTADYTRFYVTNRISGTGNHYYPQQLDAATLLVFLNGISTTSAGANSAYPFSFDQTWKLKMNLADLSLGRMSYDGKVFKGRIFLGMRAAWIDQDLQSDFIANLTNGGQEIGFAGTSLQTKSWGVGTRIGLDTTWKIGRGFQFYGNGSGDVLYTEYKYQGISFAEVPTAALPVDWNSNVLQRGISAIRLHTDLELGFKWSKCFHRQKARFDLSAGYGFQVYFDQNMFRFFSTAYEKVAILQATSALVGVLAAPLGIAPNGNLYIQGLRVAAAITY